LSVFTEPIRKTPAQPGPPAAVYPHTYARTYPTTGMQSLMCMRLASGGAPQIDVETVIIRLGRKLIARHLQTALDSLAGDYEVLRTSYSASSAESWLQHEHAPGTLSHTVAAPIVDELPISSAQLHDTAAAGPLRPLVDELAARPFDLAQPPLLRCHIGRGPTDDLLILTIHHLVYDGACAVELLESLIARYRAAAQQADLPTRQQPLLTPAVAPPLTIGQFSELATQLSPSAAHAAAAHWQTVLAGATGELDLRLDRNPENSATQDSILQPIPPAVMAALDAAAQQHGLTPATLVQLAWATLLARYSGQSDVTWGNTRAGRAGVSPHASTTVGMCVITTPARLNLLPTTTALDLAHQLRRQQLAGRPFEHFPLLKIKRAAGLQGAPFNSIVVYDRQQAAATLADKLSAAVGAYVQVRIIARPGVPLCLLISGGQASTLELIYQTDTIPPAQARAIAAHLQHLLCELGQDLGRPIAAIPHLPADHPARRLNDHAQPAPPLPPAADCLIHRLFEQTAAAHPAAIALTAIAPTVANNDITYHALNTAADHLAAALTRLGIGPGDYVPILLGRTAAYPVAVLAILKAGAAYAPLETSSPSARQQTILHTLKPRLVVCSPTTLPLARSLGLTHLLILSDDGLPLECPPSIAPTPHTAAPLSGDSPANIMFTSGSTGTPKGVIVPHRAIVRLIRNTFLPFQPTDRYLLHSALAFDASTLELWAPLLTGGQLTICPGDSFDIDALRHSLLTSKANRLWLTSTVFDRIVDTCPDMLQHVESLLVGGEALSVQHVARAIALYPKLNLINGYGPTENTTFTTTHPITLADTRRRSIPIGRPIAHTTVHVLDIHHQPADIGFTGELFASGAGLAVGYLADEPLTQSRFVHVASLPPLYRTGDFVRHLPDGSLEFLGRADSQLKIRGMRIDLGEIESALLRSGMVSAACVFTDGDRASKRLLAAVVAAPSLDIQKLTAHLAAALPAYLRPSTIFRVDTLPTTPTGKVDAAALRLLIADQPNQTCQPTGSDAEQTIARIMARVIGLPSAPIDIGFRDLGGHSLAAIDFALHIESEFAIKVPANLLATNPTSQDLARRFSHGSTTIHTPLITKLAGPPDSQDTAPIVLVPGIDGTLLQLGDLTHALAASHPVFGLRHHGTEPGETPDPTIPDMARRCLEPICRAAAGQPVHLVGYSIGGLLAYEIALQLLAAGHGVASITLIDVATPQYVLRKKPLGQRLLKAVRSPALVPWILYHSLRRRLAGTEKQIAGTTSDQPTDAPQTPLAAKIAVRVGYFPKAEDVAQRQMLEAMGHYTPQPLPPNQPLHLITSKDTDHTDPRASGWRPLVTGNLKIDPLPGDHLEIVKPPHVHQLARLLTAAFAPTQH
jgi:amino acid adenylation domain-containing protein